MPEGGKDGFQIDPSALSAASTAFGDAATDLLAGKNAYQVGAQPTGNCFGMVEGASDQLSKDYGTFYNHVLTQLGGMCGALDYLCGRTITTQTNYTGAENASTTNGGG